MSVTQALPVSMKSFKKLLASVSPEIAICVRGRHAVGKSEGVYQSAAEQRSDLYKNPEFCEEMVKAFKGKVKHATGYKTKWTYEDGLPVMERRLSQMTEGDTIGLPFDSEYGTVFKPCDWLLISARFPTVLFLDERNRALEGVKQSVFQICDSKAFYGARLHDETRVIIAENVGDEYQVQACDPAEVSRTATVVLEPTVKDWLEWAKGKCHDATVEFIRQNNKYLEHTKVFEPNKKYPDRRMWVKLDAEAQRLGLFDEPENSLLYTLAGSMVGVEAASAFQKFLAERERNVKAEDILKDWKKAKRRLAGKDSVSNESYVECVAKIGDFLEEHNITEDQAEQLGIFMHDCPSEPRMACWSTLQKNVNNLFKVHPYIEELMVITATDKQTTDLKPVTKKERLAKKKEAKSEPKTASKTKAKRGGRRK